MFHSELHHQCLALVAEGLESGRQGIELGILACLEPFIFVQVTIELAGTENEFSKIRLAFVFKLAISPPVSVHKLFFEEDKGFHSSQAGKAEQQRYSG